MKAPIEMRLRLVASVDFRRGVPTHVEELKAIDRWPNLRDDEVVLLVSQTGLQLAFVWQQLGFDGGPRRGLIHGISSYRIQLDKKTPWDPLMLRNYAERAGVKLVGIKRFEEFLTVDPTQPDR